MPPPNSLQFHPPQFEDLTMYGDWDDTDFAEEHNLDLLSQG
jgi:hypothetical protein